MSPDLLIPPSAKIRTFFFAATCEAECRAVIWGIPTPATTLVVQIEPGPCPTLIAFAPAFAKNSTPSAEVTFPAINVRSGNWLLNNWTISPMDFEKPCAVDIAIASIFSSTSFPTWVMIRSLSIEPSALRWGAIEAPQINWKSSSRAGFTSWLDSLSIRSISDKVNKPHNSSLSLTTSSLWIPRWLVKNWSATLIGSFLIAFSVKV